jgi:hypothetical protein
MALTIFRRATLMLDSVKTSLLTAARSDRHKLVGGGHAAGRLQVEIEVVKPHLK